MVLRLEKVVTSKQLRLAVEIEEERRSRLENDAATKRLKLAMEMDEERKARLEKMVATVLVQAFCEMTSHKLQQKRTQLILFPKGILVARKKVLRNPLGGRL